jgi:hypothetical protein
VIGALAVALLRIEPTAAPDIFITTLLALTEATLVLRKVKSFPLVVGGVIARTPRKILGWEQLAKLIS